MTDPDDHRIGTPGRADTPKRRDGFLREALDRAHELDPLSGPSVQRRVNQMETVEGSPDLVRFRCPRRLSE